MDFISFIMRNIQTTHTESNSKQNSKTKDPPNSARAQKSPNYTINSITDSHKTSRNTKQLNKTIVNTTNLYMCKTLHYTIPIATL